MNNICGKNLLIGHLFELENWVCTHSANVTTLKLYLVKNNFKCEVNSEKSNLVWLFVIYAIKFIH